VGDEQVERFTVWSSKIVGVVGLVAVAVIVLLGVTGVGGDYHPAVYAVCGLIGVMIWVVIIRPEVAIAGDRLVLRNPLNKVGIPLAAIEQIAVRRWVAVRVGDRTLTNAGISRSRRQGVRDDQRKDVTGIEIAALSYGAIVERRIQRQAEEARDRQGIKLHSDEQLALAADVRKTWAWPEIATLAVLSVAVVVTMLAY
jgi:hypothetical protein